MPTTNVSQLISENILVVRSFMDDGHSVWIHIYFSCENNGVFHVTYAANEQDGRMDVELFSPREFYEHFSSTSFEKHSIWSLPEAVLGIRSFNGRHVVIPAHDACFMGAYERIALRLPALRSDASLHFTAFLATQKLQWIGDPRCRTTKRFA